MNNQTDPGLSSVDTTGVILNNDDSSRVLQLDSDRHPAGSAVHPVRPRAFRSAVLSQLGERGMSAAGIYRVHYTRVIDNAQFRRDFSSHERAKQFAAKKMHEPGWKSGWPVKIADATKDVAAV